MGPIDQSQKQLPGTKDVAFDLKALDLMRGASAGLIQGIAETSAIRNFSANDCIWKAGDSGEFFAIIISGLIEGTRYAAREGETVISLFGPSDVIGLPAVIRKSTYPGTARVLTTAATIVKCFPHALLSASHPHALEFQAWLRDAFLRYEQILRDKIDILNAGTVECRVFELLIHLLRRFGKPESAMAHFIPIRLTRAQIGRMTNVRGETVIRIISRWQKEHLVTWTKEGIRVNNLSLLEKSIASKK